MRYMTSTFIYEEMSADMRVDPHPPQGREADSSPLTSL